MMMMIMMMSLRVCDGFFTYKDMLPMPVHVHAHPCVTGKRVSLTSCFSKFIDIIAVLALQNGGINTGNLNPLLP